MEALTRLYGIPHEALHVLALWLIGRRATAVTRTHVDIPDNLPTGQYVFVAGLPALVFGTLTLISVIGLLSAATFMQTILAFVGMTAAGLGLAGTVGDIELIAARLADEDHG